MPSPKWLQLPLYGEATSGDGLFSRAILPPNEMEKAMAEEKIEIEQIEEFTEELSDEALDSEETRWSCPLLCC